MRRFRCHKCIEENPELTNEIMGIVSMELFIILDLLLFTVFLGILLHAATLDFRIYCFVPIGFFAFFYMILKFVIFPLNKS
jgi:hypothetical protein